jgi:uncharacterized integral membrane protein
MPFFVIVAVALAAISAIFAIQNAGVITVSFLGWEWEASLALILIVSLGVGVVIGYLAGLPSMFRKASQLRQTKRELDGLGSVVAQPEDEIWADEVEGE